MKKTLSFLAALVMGCTAAPMTVFAQDDVYSGYEMGDVTMDGIIDIDDADMILEYYVLCIAGILEDGEYTVDQMLVLETLGDYNNDNTVDAFDVCQIINDHIPLLVEYNRGDVNKDGNVDASDASAILAYYAEIQTSGYISEENTEVFKILGDYTQDKVTDAQDASAIIERYIFTQTNK